MVRRVGWRVGRHTARGTGRDRGRLPNAAPVPSYPPRTDRLPATRPGQTGIPPTDSLVPCPRCELMGHHEIAYRDPGPVTIPGPSGPVDVSPIEWDRTAPYLVRTCLFCDHTWYVRVAGYGRRHA